MLSVYKYLLNHYLNWYVDHNPNEYIGRQVYQNSAGLWRLTFEEKRSILLRHLRGVDIDSNAVEVTQFSLLLKLIEDESEHTLNDFVIAKKMPALPLLSEIIRCGNSLVCATEWQAAYGQMSEALLEKVNPFTWADEFPAEMANGGFHVIVGNPPYIRIQKMVAYSPEETSYYRCEGSPYTTGCQDNFDKYALFIERSLSLVRPDGRFGVIIPHKFMSIHAGLALRALLTTDQILEEIVHFGTKQVFGSGISNYTCIVIMDRAGTENVKLEQPGLLEAWRYGQEGSVTVIPSKELGADPWDFSDEETRKLFSRVRDQFQMRLSDVADIKVGVQTSADDIYIIKEMSSDAATVIFRWNNQDWRIERSILRACLHDVTIFPYTRPVPNAWAIFPYEFVVLENNKVRARLIQPDEMTLRYPLCWNYFCARREELEQRNIVGGPAAERQWYQYGRSQSLTEFEQPKIIFPVLSKEARYAYDEANSLFTGGGNGPYYMVRARDSEKISTLYLLAILNHPLSEALVRTHTSPFRGGYYSHGKQFIENLPVPFPKKEQHAEIAAKASELIVSHNELSLASTPYARMRKQREVKLFRNKLDESVSALFSLSIADIDIIKSVPIPN